MVVADTITEEVTATMYQAHYGGWVQAVLVVAIAVEAAAVADLVGSAEEVLVVVVPVVAGKLTQANFLVQFRHHHIWETLTQ